MTLLFFLRSHWKILEVDFQVPLSIAFQTPDAASTDVAGLARVTSLTGSPRVTQSYGAARLTSAGNLTGTISVAGTARRTLADVTSRITGVS